MTVHPIVFAKAPQSLLPETSRKGQSTSNQPIPIGFGQSGFDLSDYPYKPSLKELGTELDRLGGRKNPRQAVEKFALKLFSSYRTKEELLQFIRMAGVDVYDAKEHAWVAQTLKAAAAEAFVSTPYRWYYPEQPYTPAMLTSIPGASREMARLDEHSERNRKIVMLCTSDAPIEFLMHELYHIIQSKAGVPVCSGNLSVDKKAAEVMMNTMGRLSLKNPFKLAVTLLDIFITSRKSPEDNFQQPDAPIVTVGDVVRKRALRELDTYQFFLTYGQSLGLDPRANAMNKAGIVFYKALGKYSHKWDALTAEALRKQG